MLHSDSTTYNVLLCVLKRVSCPSLCVQKREIADKAREESDKKKVNYSQGKMFGVSVDENAHLLSTMKILIVVEYI